MATTSSIRSSIVTFAVFCLFVGFQYKQGVLDHAVKQLPPVPKDVSVLQFNFAEPYVLSRALMLWLQTFDSQSGKIIQYDELNYKDIINWLTVVRTLHPNSQYPLLTAIHLFTETKDKDKVRQMIRFVEDSFHANPDQFWRWQANAIILSKHRLNDIEYALKLAKDLNAKTKTSKVAQWARDMEFLILEDMGEFEASALLIKSMLDSGTITEARELRFLTNKLKEIKRK